MPGILINCQTEKCDKLQFPWWCTRTKETKIMESAENQDQERKSFPLDSSAKEEEEDILTKIVRTTESASCDQTYSNFHYLTRSVRRCRVEPTERASELALKHPMLCTELSKSEESEDEENSTRHAWDLSCTSSNVDPQRESKPVSTTDPSNKNRLSGKYFVA